MYKALSVTFLILTASLLSACSSDFFAAPVEASCPEARVLDGGANLVRYQPGGGRDITDVLLETEFIRVAGECNVDDEMVEVGLLVVLDATKGPALESDQTTTSIIMAVTDLDRNIINRRTMDISLDFTGNRGKISYLERFLIDIPLKEGQKADDFVIFLSFELSREEYKFNKNSTLF
ncbi:hypothetical protein [Aestuariispira insulae]|uniref:Lipoprotein n=1 Tax=Aestuariispira insulae TaxID=1461337 RepID=A0A3D9HGF7_9PROT|nr:hypothetical protein [Aestuariispira insulae]RED48582.1 hypothetical protein DFP90_10785 [Aestuariispira insulae]